MNSDGDKFYTKLVAFHEIYNFVFQTCFIWSHFAAQKIDILSRSDIENRDLETSLNYKIETRNDFIETGFNYKIVDLVEGCKFLVKFISIQVHTKTLWFFENRLTLTAMGHVGWAL
jgi:hypothetical protein